MRNKCIKLLKNNLITTVQHLVVR